LSYDIDLQDIIRVAVVLVGLFLVASGFADLARVSLAERVIESIFRIAGTGLLKILVGGIFVLAVVNPDSVEDFVDGLRGR